MILQFNIDIIESQFMLPPPATLKVIFNRNELATQT